jgi:uncharacterized membrane protein YhdT
MSVVPSPLSNRGRILFVALTVLAVAIWIIGLYCYFLLPKEVPTQFAFSGEPTHYGARSTFLIVPTLSSLFAIIILVVVRFRFTLFSKYPYMLNLPAFFTYIFQIPEQRRGFWLNRYFEAVLGLGIALTLYLTLLMIGSYEGSASGTLPSWFVSAAILFPIAFIVPFIYIMAMLSRQMRREVI